MARRKQQGTVKTMPDLSLPSNCAECGAPTERGNGLCAACAVKVLHGLSDGPEALPPEAGLEPPGSEA
jgi:predicted amidophosphoribosyltransferase